MLYRLNKKSGYLNKSGSRVKEYVKDDCHRVIRKHPSAT